MSAFSLLSDVDDDQPRVEALKQKEAAAAARASPDLAELASRYNRSTVQPASPSRVGGSSTAHADSRAPFQSTKVLGEDVVVIRHLSKRYQLAGRNGAGHGDSKNNGRLGSTPASAGQEGDEVVALRHINLIPLGEEPEADAAEEAGSLQPRLPRSLDVPARGSMAHSSHMHPIRRGEFIMIRGPSGGGKTTLLNILGTIDEASSGSVEMFGRTISKASTDKELAQLRLEKIGFVFQTFNLLATMSAFENVELPMVILGKLSRAACKARALELLDLVGLQDRYAHLPSELSGGEQQRVTIARALANEPELLLLDEPTGDLDSRNTVDVMDLILRINLGTLGQPVVDGASSGGGNGGGARAKQALTATSTTPTTVVMVTHNPDLECYADRILYVEDGAFKKQALNRKQRRIQYDKFLEYINKSN